MNLYIYTSDAEAVDPAEIAAALADWFVLTVDVNDGERVWRNPVYPLNDES